jgi:cytochrome b involved in lipid metabolism
MNIATKKTMFSRDAIWLNKTYSQHMGILQADFISSEVDVKAEDMEEEESYALEVESHVGLPPTITEDDHIEHLMDVPETTSSPKIVAPYPTSTRQLRSSVVHAPKKISREIRSLQSNHFAYITQALPETKDQANKNKFAMIQAAFHSVAGFDDGSDTPKTYKEVLKHKNPEGWWSSMKK